MEPAPVPPLQKLPLHVIARVLERLDTIPQLGRAVLSHRLFHDAMVDNFRSVTTTVLTNQIPLNTLPFSLALLESERIDVHSEDQLRGLFDRLTESIADEQVTWARLTRLPLVDYAYLSRVHTDLEFLGRNFAGEAFPILSEKMQVHHPPELSVHERFRLDRAFIRYQLMVNLLSPNKAHGESDFGKELTRRFFLPFSAWVNEQMVCVYAHLERKVNEHFWQLQDDIPWGEKPDTWRTWPHESMRMQWILRQGIPFLATYIRAEDEYEDRYDLFRTRPYDAKNYNQNPYHQMLRMMTGMEIMPPGIRFWETHLGDFSQEQLQALVRPYDGPMDTMGSTAYRAWYGAHPKIAYPFTMFNQADRNLWHTGYVLWDDAGIPDSDLQERYHEFTKGGYMFLN